MTLDAIILKKGQTPVTDLETRRTLNNDFEILVRLLPIFEKKFHDENPNLRQRNNSRNFANQFRQIQ